MSLGISDSLHACFCVNEQGTASDQKKQKHTERGKYRISIFCQTIWKNNDFLCVLEGFCFHGLDVSCSSNLGTCKKASIRSFGELALKEVLCTRLDSKGQSTLFEL